VAHLPARVRVAVDPCRSRARRAILTLAVETAADFALDYTPPGRPRPGRWTRERPRVDRRIAADRVPGVARRTSRRRRS